MANRVLLDGIKTSDRIDLLTCEAERFYYRLLTVPDDFGCTDARPAVLRAACFPLKPEITTADVAGWLAELQAAELLDLYVSDGKLLLEMTGWKAQIRSRAPRWPSRTAENTCGPMDTAEILRVCADLRRHRRACAADAKQMLSTRTADDEHVHGDRAAHDHLIGIGIGIESGIGVSPASVQRSDAQAHGTGSGGEGPPPAESASPTPPRPDADHRPAGAQAPRRERTHVAGCACAECAPWSDPARGEPGGGAAAPPATHGQLELGGAPASSPKRARSAGGKRKSGKPKAAGEKVDPRCIEDERRYLARYRELAGNPAADFTGPGVFTFRALWAKHGPKRLFAALEGAMRDPFVRRHRQLPWVCSQAGVEHGMKGHLQQRPTDPVSREEGFRRDAAAGVTRDFTDDDADAVA